MSLTNEDLLAISDLIQPIKDDLQEVKHKLTSIQIHLENGTDKNIQLIAENFIELTNKLNQAIPVADKNLDYEVKVNYLVESDRLDKKLKPVNDRLKKIELTQENDILPRLQNIESCYTSTYK